MREGKSDFAVLYEYIKCCNFNDYGYFALLFFSFLFSFLLRFILFFLFALLCLFTTLINLQICLLFFIIFLFLFHSLIIINFQILLTEKGQGHTEYTMYAANKDELGQMLDVFCIQGKHVYIGKKFYII